MAFAIQPLLRTDTICWSLTRQTTRDSGNEPIYRAKAESVELEDKIMTKFTCLFAMMLALLSLSVASAQRSRGAGVTRSGAAGVKAGGVSHTGVKAGGVSHTGVAVGGASRTGAVVGGTSGTGVAVGGSSTTAVTTGGVSRTRVAVGGASRTGVAVGKTSAAGVKAGGAAHTRRR